MDSPCSICKGACCERILIPFTTATDESLQWLNFHENVWADKKGLRINCKCSHLTSEGKCGIYKSRPDICRKYKIGSPACINAINEQRKIKEPIFKAIREWDARTKS